MMIVLFLLTVFCEERERVRSFLNWAKNVVFNRFYLDHWRKQKKKKKIRRKEVPKKVRATESEHTQRGALNNAHFSPVANAISTTTTVYDRE